MNIKKITKKISNLILSLVILTSLFSNLEAQESKEVALKVGDESVSLSEFEYLYKKNKAQSQQSWSKNDIQEYLDLYIKFKLKVMEAKRLGLDTAKSFVKEYEGYRKQLAKPYLTERSVSEKLVKEAYERLKQEVRASHLLIQVNEYAEPSDTLAAFKRIQELRKRIVKGEKFEDIAFKFSYDKSVSRNKGDLGYFTALQMVYPFESMAYDTKVGEISPVFRTKFGYHILKVTDKRKSNGSVKAAHIMIRATEGLEEADSIAAHNKVIELAKQLKEDPTKWNDLCTQFSDDYRTRNEGGELAWFSSGNMLPSFESATFALKNKGDISAPVKTPYGWHLIRLIDRKPLESFEKLEPVLKQKVTKDSRAALQERFFIQRLKKENRFVENKSVNQLIMSELDSTLLSANWKYSQANKALKTEVFKIEKKSFSLTNFYDYVLKSQKRQGKDVTASAYMRVLYQNFVTTELTNFEESQLETKYAEFAHLTKEYYEGILLFQIMDKNVWSKALSDKKGLDIYYNSHKNKYQWKPRAEASIFNLATEKDLEKLKEDLKEPYFRTEEVGSIIHLIYDKGADQPKNKVENIEKFLKIVTKNKEYNVLLTSYSAAKENSKISTNRIKSIKERFTTQNIDTERFIIKQIQKADERVSKEEGHIIVEIVSNSAKVLEKRYNKDKPLSLQVEEGLFEKGANKFLNAIDWKSGTYTLKEDGRIQYIVVKSIREGEVKALSSVRGTVISDYQKHLEEEWIKGLETTFKVKVNQKVIDKLIKN
jgi:peptidyl-prolyl cis-trans isomerase SurA